LINLPIGILGLVAGLRYLPNGAAANVSRLDITGTFLVAAATLAFLFPIVEGRHYGWPLWGFALMLLSAVLVWRAAAYFRARMNRDGAALVPPALFEERSFSIGLAIIVLFQGAMAGFLLCFTLTLQQGLGFSALETALIHVPFAAGATFSIGVLSGKALPRVGPTLVTIGAGILSVGLLLLLLAVTQPIGVWWYVWCCSALLIAGLGMGLVSGPTPPITLSNIDRSYAGAAGGVVKAGQNLGSASGAAAIGALYFTLTQDLSGALALHAFVSAVIVVIAILAVVALLSQRVPRDLRLMTRPTAER
jgi:predicted MFS family arabinose efflux permease